LYESMDRKRKVYASPVVFGEDLMRFNVGESVKVLTL
jgi:hypothetical protein